MLSIGSWAVGADKWTGRSRALQLVLLPALALLAFAPYAAAEERQPAFAALSVYPAGDQVYDLATGVTTLPEGGEIIDQDSGITLTGSFVRYQEGRFIEAEQAVIQAANGTLEAAEVRIDVDAATLAATEATFATRGLVTSAAEVRIDLREDIVMGHGHVVSERPHFEADVIIVLVGLQRAFLVGPYVYRDGPVTLRGTAASDRMQVDWTIDNDDAGHVDFDATTEVDRKTWDMVEPLLP